MPISDEEKRKIMDELARGNSASSQEPSQNEAKDYEFDGLAQPDWAEQRQLFSQSFRLEQSESATSNSIKERITSDLNQAKQVGQLKTERIREIVSSAVFQVASEFKSASSDINLIVKDAVSAAIENFQEKGGEIKEEITASIEGGIEGISNWRRQNIVKSQAEVKQLQNKIDNEEEQLQQEINRLLTDIEEAGKTRPPSIKASLDSAINTLKNSEEVALMKKRYAQLQSQVAILRANLAARYGGRYDEVKEHLDEAKAWHNQTRPQEGVVDQTEKKRSQLEESLGDAGAAIAKKERRVRQILSELLRTGAELLRDKETPSK